MLFLIILSYVIIALIEVAQLYKKNQKKECITYMILLSVALILSILLYLGVEMPSASRLIAKIVKFLIGK
jgi:hypothetical protein